MQTQSNTIQRKHKSVKLDAPFMRSLKMFIGDFPTKEVAAEQIGITRQGLDAILLRKTASSDTVNKILAVIKSV